MRHFLNGKPDDFLKELEAYIAAHRQSCAEKAGAGVRVVSGSELDFLAGDASCQSEAPCAASAELSAPRGHRAHRSDRQKSIVLPPRQPSFQQMMFEMIERTGKKDSEIYKKGGY